MVEGLIQRPDPLGATALVFNPRMSDSNASCPVTRTWVGLSLSRSATPTSVAATSTQLLPPSPEKDDLSQLSSGKLCTLSHVLGDPMDELHRLVRSQRRVLHKVQSQAEVLQLGW